MNKKKPAKQNSLTKEWPFKRGSVLGFFATPDSKSSIIQFGWRKADLILRHKKELEAFVAKHRPQEASTA